MSDGEKNRSKNSDRVVLGIDPGTGRCGWGIVGRRSQVAGRGTGQAFLIDCGCIETPAKTPLVERLEIIYRKISQLILEYHPTEMAVEELFFVKNIKTGISVSHARGVIMLSAKLQKIKIFEYKPNVIKSAIVGYGHASKLQMQKMLKIHLKGTDVRQDDAVDAVCVALTHLQINTTFSKS